MTVLSAVALTATSMFVAPAQIASAAAVVASETPPIPVAPVVKLPANAPKTSPFPAPPAPVPPPAPHDVPLPASALPPHSTTDPVAVAIAQAQISGQRVEVVADRTDDDTTYANPDASLTTEIAAGPVRVMQAGVWVPVDPTLVAANGVVAPRAVEGDVQFSDGAAAAGTEVAGLTSASTHLGFAWPTALPAPTLSGATATYHDVIAGGDLVVTATTTGFDVSLVLRQAPTAAVEYRLPLNLTGLSLAQAATGSLSLKGSSGATVASAPAPEMFSASIDPHSDEPSQTETVASSVANDPGGPVLVLQPDLSFLTDPATVYPVTIDPATTLTSDLSNYVTSDARYTNQNYDSSTVLNVGTYNGSVVDRSFVRFGDSAIKGATVTSATLNLYETWAYSCTPAQMYVEGAGTLNAGSTWNTQPSTDGDAWYSGSFSGGYTGCTSNPAGEKALDVTGLAQKWSSDGVASPEALALLAPNEANPYQWKTFDSDNTTNPPTMSVTYNTAAVPSAPQNVVGVPGNAAGTITWAAPSYLGSPALSAYYIYNYGWNGSSWTYLSYNTCGASCTSTTFTGLINGGIYAAYVFSWNTSGLGGNASAFYYPAAPPSAPTNVVAGGGNASATARWTAPASNGGSAITNYILEADDVNHPATYYLGAACGTCTNGTVPGLTNGHTYAVYVWANNAVGTPGPYGLSNDVFTGATDPMAGAGQRGDFTQQTYNLTDTLTATVNVGTGNLELAATDMVLPGVDGGDTLGRVYNSLSAAAGSSSWFSPDFGYTWRFDQAPDVRLTFNANGSIAYDTAGGNVATFATTGTGYTTPPGLDAGLALIGDGSYTLTFYASAEVEHFGADGNLLSGTDRNGNTVSYPDSRLVTTVAGDAGTSPANSAAIAYAGPGGRVSSITQTVTGGSRTVTYGYETSDSLGDSLETVTNANGGVTTYGYDANDNVNLVTSPYPLLAVTKFTYDATHQVTSVDRVIPGAPDDITTYTYTTPNETEVTDGDGHPPTIYTTNAAGEVTGSTDAAGNTTATTYSPDAQVATSENALTGMTTNTYGANSGQSLTNTIGPTGVQTGATYSNVGYPYLPSSGVDTMDNTSTVGYTAGNLNVTADALSDTTKYSYNTDGTVATSTAPNNETGSTNPTKYAYNTVHQLTSITAPTGNSLGVQTFTYDAFGRLLTAKIGLGMTTTYAYDNVDRVVSETHSDGTPTITYSYDSDGNPYQQTDVTGTTTFTYNAANELTAETIPAGPTFTYTYDPAGNLTSAGGDGRASATVYHYNQLNQVDQMTEPNTNIDIFAYNADYQRTDTWDDTGSAVAYSGNTVVAPTSFAVHIQNAYNTANELTATETTEASSNANIVANLAYGYTVANPTSCAAETAGMVTDMRQSSTNLVAGQVTTYCYNHAAELTSAATAGGPTYSYGYDADGNRTTDAAGTHSFNSADQLTDTGSTYDADGNLTASAADPAVAYNSIDQTTTANGVSLGYAGGSQDDRTTVGATTQANGLLGVQTDTTAGVATYYERDSQGTLVSEITPSGEYYYAFDGQGSVIALIDTTGTQRAAYTYDPYGSNATATALNGTLPANPWRYDSGYLDSSGLYHFGARYYDPTTGRFTQQDPAVGPSGGNRYSYSADDPVNVSDPTGNYDESFSCSWWSGNCTLYLSKSDVDYYNENQEIFGDAANFVGDDYCATIGVALIETGVLAVAVGIACAYAVSAYGSYAEAAFSTAYKKGECVELKFNFYFSWLPYKIAPTKHHCNS